MVDKNTSIQGLLLLYCNILNLKKIKFDLNMQQFIIFPFNLHNFSSRYFDYADNI